MNVGILGGTFDPVHNGHLILAEHARTQLALDIVLFVPAGDPWRKAHRAITPAEYRLAMLMLAITDQAQFGISDIELRRTGPTYTADTLEALAAERLDDEFYFIAGADALADLPTWHDPARIVQHAMLAVAERSGHALEAAIAAVPELANRIVRFDMPPTQISSTDIRARAAAGDDITELVPPAVARYIAEHRLYVSDP
jgi:nicotinate-nucleotide adenylyltransferase